MTNQPMLNFDSVTAPDFSVDPVGYYVWHLENHPQMYRQFRDLADQYRIHNPGARLSADMICHVLRFQAGMSAAGDRFAVNNNLTSLYARLYVRERPATRIDIRRGYLDSLTPEDQARLDAAFAGVREVLDPHGGAA